MPRTPGRRFGLEVGIAAAIAGALLLRKQHGTTGVICLILALVLVLCAVVSPRVLDPIARRWLALAAAIARVTTPVMLGVVYFVVVTPMALLRRAIGRSPFTRDRDADSYWVASTSRTAEEQRARMERQF